MLSLMATPDDTAPWMTPFITLNTVMLTTTVHKHIAKS